EAEARRELERARASAAAASVEATEAATRASMLTEQCEAMGHAIREHPDRDAVAAALARVDELERARRAAHTARDACALAHREADAAMKAAQKQADRVSAVLRAQRDALVAAGLAPPAVGDDPDTAWPALVEFAAQHHAEQQKLRHELDAELHEAT